MSSNDSSTTAAREPAGPTPAIRPVAAVAEPEHPFGAEPRHHVKGEDASRFIPPGSEKLEIPEGFWDPRENEPWFHDLSARDKDHFRRMWVKEQNVAEYREKWNRDRLIHSLVECTLLFGVGQALLVQLCVRSVILGTLVGVAVGYTAYMLKSTRAPGILLGFAAMVVLQTSHVLLGGKPADIFSLILFWLLTIGTFMSAGIRREGEQFGA